MVEVMYPRDIEKINDPEVASYLHKRFQEIDHVLHPQTEGYFLYVEAFTSLYKKNTQYYLVLPSIQEGLFNKIENVEVENGVVEVSLLFNNEFMISLIFHNLTAEELQVITKEVKR